MKLPDLDRLADGLMLASVVGFALFVVLSWAVAPAATASTEVANDTTLVGAMGNGYDGTAYELDERGNVLWSTPEAVSYTDVQRLEDGTVLAGFQDKSDDCPTGDSCIRTGARVFDVAGDEPEIVWEYSFTVKTMRNSEVHDVDYLQERDEFLLADMDRERIFTVDRESKEVTWQWNASEFYEAPPDPTTTDWLHINDVDHIGDDRYLVSVRNANQLVIVERGEGVVDVINENHDPSVLDHQHNPQWLGDGAVLVADSENDRVVELHEQENGTWTVAWARYEANGIRFDWPRDADRLASGNTLVTDTRNARLVEISPNGEVVWRADLREQAYDADRGGSEYPAGQRMEPEVVDVPLEQPSKLISALYGGLRHVLVLPNWINEWHVLAFIGMVDALCVGVMLRLVSGFRESTRAGTTGRQRSSSE